MVNSGSFESDADRNSKIEFTQHNTVTNGSQSLNVVPSTSTCLCENNFNTQTADSLPASTAIEPTATKTEFKCNMSCIITKDEISSTENSDIIENGDGNADLPVWYKLDRKFDCDSVNNVNDKESNVKTSLFCSVPLDKVQDILKPYSVFKAKNSDAQSVKSKMSKKLLCLYCDRTFVTPNLKQKHMDRCHSYNQLRRSSSRRFNNKQPSTPCLYCNRFTTTDHNLKELFQHFITNHSNKYFGCLPCESRFSTLQLLKDHNVTLHGIIEDEEPAKVGESKHNINKPNGITNGTMETFDSRNTRAKTKIDEDLINFDEDVPLSLLHLRTARDEQWKRGAKNKKIAVNSNKLGIKNSTRMTRLQTKAIETTKKKRRKNAKTEPNEKNTTKTVQPHYSFPSYDFCFRVKKITDHSIDNIRIDSLTFDDVFDKAFFNRIKCNIQENLLNHIDGKLFKNVESENRISNFEKNNIQQEFSNVSSSENFGCELSLNAATPVVTFLTSSQFGEDIESQIEYGSKASKKKAIPKKDEVHYKYFTRRKYQAIIRESKDHRDLSKLDMWTQLAVKNRQQKISDQQKSNEELLQQSETQDYKTKMQVEELNRILDRRGPFDDLKEEAVKKAALEKLNTGIRDVEIVTTESYSDVMGILCEIINKVAGTDVRTVCEVQEDHLEVSVNQGVDSEKNEDIPFFLNLRRTSSLPLAPEIDRSDKISLICSSQETENFEVPTARRDKDAIVELTGEWARSRIYICSACGQKLINMKSLIDHKNTYHQTVWCQHYEFVGSQSTLYRHLCIPGLGKVGCVEDFSFNKSWKRSDARVCSKCNKQCNSLGELHRHVLECGGDWSWLLSRRKCKYRPYGAKSRRKRRGLLRRNICRKRTVTDNETLEKKKYTYNGPRQRPSDAETIERMLANLPPKRATRKMNSLKDGIQRPRKNRNLTNANNTKLEKSKRNKKTIASTTNMILRRRNKKLNEQTAEQTEPGSSKMIRKRSIKTMNKVLSSNMLNTNSTLLFKHKLKNSLQRKKGNKAYEENEPEEETAKKSKENSIFKKVNTFRKSFIRRRRNKTQIEETLRNVVQVIADVATGENLDLDKQTDEKSESYSLPLPRTRRSQSSEKPDARVGKKKGKFSKAVDAVLSRKRKKDIESQKGEETGKRVKRKYTFKNIAKKIKGALSEKAVEEVQPPQKTEHSTAFLEETAAPDDFGYMPTLEKIIPPVEVANENDAIPILTPITLNFEKENKVDESTTHDTVLDINEPIRGANDIEKLIGDNNKSDNHELTLPKPKGKPKKTKGLNDCIAMLASKLQQRSCRETIDMQLNIEQIFKTEVSSIAEQPSLEVQETLTIENCDNPIDIPEVEKDEINDDNANGDCVEGQTDIPEVELSYNDLDKKIELPEATAKQFDVNSAIVENLVNKEVEQGIESKQPEINSLTLTADVKGFYAPRKKDHKIGSVRNRGPKKLKRNENTIPDTYMNIKVFSEYLDDISLETGDREQNNMNRKLPKLKIKYRKIGQTRQRRVVKMSIREPRSAENNIDNKDVINQQDSGKENIAIDLKMTKPKRKYKRKLKVVESTLEEKPAESDSEDEIPLALMIKNVRESFKEPFNDLLETKTDESSENYNLAVNEKPNELADNNKVEIIKPAKRKYQRRKPLAIHSFSEMDSQNGMLKKKRSYRRKNKENHLIPPEAVAEMEEKTTTSEISAETTPISEMEPLPLEELSSELNNNENENVTQMNSSCSEPPVESVPFVRNVTTPPPVLQMDDSFITSPDLNNVDLAAKIKTACRLKLTKPKKQYKTKKIVVQDETDNKAFCEICLKSFKRAENLLKHNRTLTHISKLSELEARACAAKDDKPKSYSDVEEEVAPIPEMLIEEPQIVEFELPKSSLMPSTFSLNSTTDTLKLADIINDVLNKPVENEIMKHNSFSDFILPLDNVMQTETRRYKSLGERKSFESDTIANGEQSVENLHANTADTILEKQISLLETIIEENRTNMNYMDEISVSSKESVIGNGSNQSPSRLSIISDSKQDDCNQISFSHDTNIITNFMKPNLCEDHFLKPTQYEEISDDGMQVRGHFEERTRKTLNRDEELFLECCSLLKSSSEVSSQSKKSHKAVPLYGNLELKSSDEPEWLEQKRFPSHLHYHSNSFGDTSRMNTPIGDSFGDDDSNTMISEWNFKDKSELKKQENTNFLQIEPPIFENISLDSKSSFEKTEDDDRSMNFNNFNHFNNGSCNAENSLEAPIEIRSVEQDAEDYEPFEDVSETTTEMVQEKPKEVDEELKKRAVSKFGDLIAKALKGRLHHNITKKTKRKKLEAIQSTQMSIKDYALDLSKNKVEDSLNNENKKMLTKGAMKVFEGLKVSIPTDELDMNEVLNCSPSSKRLEIEADKLLTNGAKHPHLLKDGENGKLNKNFLKNFGNKLGLKVTKRRQISKNRRLSKMSDFNDNQKILDVYDFEETQDNSDILNKNSLSFYRSFRSKISGKSERSKSTSSTSNNPTDNLDSDSESNKYADSFSFEAHSVSSLSTASTGSTRKLQKNITKKKCMIMGRIFKNALKSKIEDGIRDLPAIDNNKLVQNYVLNCPETPPEDNSALKNKMTVEEMDQLFDKLLNEDKSKAEKGQSLFKTPFETDQGEEKVDELRGRKGVKTRKRRRKNSESSTDEEFSLNKASKKRVNRRNFKIKNNSINLEQELKECIGVAGRKSQRKCTSGKQNVLVEFWSSDESNFETVFEQKLAQPEEIPDRPKIEISTADDIAIPENEFPIEVGGETTDEPIDIAFDRIEKHRKHRKKRLSEKNHRRIENQKLPGSESIATTRRKRTAADTLYYWSSSTEDELESMIEIKSVRDELDEEDRPMQHGWIVGDSPKKLVTMLAQAKGKKFDVECVKEQGKKRSSL